MLRVMNLSFGFPGKDLFSGVDFELVQDAHVALIGSSGTGKSTLAKLLWDSESYTYDGEILWEAEVRAVFLPQLALETLEREAGLRGQDYSKITVFHYVAQRFLEMRMAMDATCEQLSQVDSERPELLEALLETYQHQLDAYQALDGDDVESQIQKQFNLVGLVDKLDLPVTALSGGELKLAQVIKAMLEHPQLLVMDEPDAFLDFDNLRALIQLINGYKGTLLVITHNRLVLTYCFDGILHLENRKIQQFEGTYSDYQLALLKEKVHLQEEAYKHSEAVAKNEALIERLRFAATYNSEASRGKALRARVKHHERLTASAIQAPFVEIQEPPIQFGSAPPLDFAFKLEGYSMGFDTLLLEGVDFEMGPQDKVALLGPNGSGKTSLLRDLVKAFGGNAVTDAIQVNPEAKLGYLSQVLGECLKADETPLDALYRVGLHSTKRILALLSQYGFSDSAAHDPIHKLSGGEQNVLQLAMLSVMQLNLLLLDEPTSHLDTYGQRALEQAISDFEGAVFMVSHDYYTIASCVDYVLIIENQRLRKLSLKKFRKMVFSQHFDRDALQLDHQRKLLTLEVSEALNRYDFEAAKKVLARLEALY